VTWLNSRIPGFFSPKERRRTTKKSSEKQLEKPVPEVYLFSNLYPREETFTNGKLIHQQ
jgi:hypothetical protein